MSVAKPTPKDFPVLLTRKEARSFRGPRRSWPTCPVCHLVVEPRNRNRHAKACAARKRNAPELWHRWHSDMVGGSR